MIELELLGANGGSVVMTDQAGERYSLVIDDALRAAVRRDRPASLPRPSQSPEPDAAPTTPARPKDLQALMRAGASAEEVAAATGQDVEHVRRFEGPVLAERGWAVEQARLCRIGWEKDSPLLGELVVDRLATRGVDPESLEWDALREGREPWQILVTFLEGDAERRATWTLDLPARTVAATDDEARWLTESGAAGRRPAVFDQDSEAPGASAHERTAHGSAPAEQPPAPAPSAADHEHDDDARRDAASGDPTGSSDRVDSDTDALLADLASNRGRRVEVEIPEDDEDEPGSQGAAAEADDATSPHGQARVFSMQDRRRAFAGNHPAGTKLHQGEDAPAAQTSPTAPSRAAAPQAEMDAPTAEVAEVTEHGTQDALPEMPPAPKPKPKRRPRRSVPSWDEIVFGAKPE